MWNLILRMHMVHLFHMILWIYFLCCFIFMLISWIGNARYHLKTLCFIRVETYLGGDQPYLNWLIIDTGAYFRKVELLAPIRLVKTRMVIMAIWWWQYSDDSTVMTINNMISCATCVNILWRTSMTSILFLSFVLKDQSKRCSIDH